MSKSSVKIGMIGCGKIAARHLPAYKKLGVEVAVADAIPEAAHRRASEFDITAVPTVAHLLENPSIDAIDVCVPTRYHKDVVISALLHDKHVFCEKPLAMNVEEVREIEAMQQKTGRIVSVGYLYRFYPALTSLKEMLDEGVIGNPYFATMRVGGRGSAAKWKHKQDEGGGAVREILVHHLDLALWLFGEMQSARTLWQETLLKERVVAEGLVEADAEDCILVKLQGVDGLEVLCQADLVTPSYMQHIEVQGNNGSIFTSMLHYLPTIVYCNEARGIFNQGNNFRQFPMVNVFEVELEHFIEAVAGGRLAVNGVSDSEKVMLIVDSLRGEAQSLGEAL